MILKKLLICCCMILSLSSCTTLMGGKHVIMPTIDIPKEVDKPQIDSKVIQFENKFYVAYTQNDALKLYKYLLEKDSYIDKLIFRINSQNQLIKKFGEK
jgi:hypothetical protein